jgi:hypothetical protein
VSIEQLGEAPRGIGDDSPEQRPPVAEQPVHRGRVEELGVVLDEHEQPLGRLVDVEREVEARRIRRERERPRLEPGQLHGLDLRPALEGEQHLEEGRAAGDATRLQGLDQGFQRHVLVGEGLERHLAHAP